MAFEAILRNKPDKVHRVLTQGLDKRVGCIRNVGWTTDLQGYAQHPTTQTPPQLAPRTKSHWSSVKSFVPFQPMKKVMQIPC